MRVDDKNLARRLRNLPNPEPPADLLERLIEEIPDSIPQVGSPPQPIPKSMSKSSPATERWRLWAVAASLVTVVGGGFLAYRVSQVAPPLAEVAKEGRAVAPMVSTVDVEAATRDRVASSQALPDLRPRAEPEAEIPGLAEVDSGVAERPRKRSAETAEEPRGADTPSETSKERIATGGRRSVAGDGESGPGGVTTEASNFSASHAPEAKAEKTAGEAEPSQAIRDDLQALGYVTAAPAEESRQGLAREGSAAAPSPGAPRRSGRPAAFVPPPPPRDRDEGTAIDAVVEAEAVEESVVLDAPGHRLQEVGGQLAMPEEKAKDDSEVAIDTMIFQDYGTNPFVDTTEDSLSTFGLDVDTGSFNLVRRYLTDGRRPPMAAVRVEELVNAMRYPDLVVPKRADFALAAEWGPSPWGDRPAMQLVRLTVQGREAIGERRATDLILVVDTSGSMNRENRLGLVKRSLELLIEELGPQDRLALVTYGSRGRVVLEPTADRAAVLDALGSLRSSGSTNAEEGLTLAYDLAQATARPGVSQRILLCSDGVANVGRTGPGSILERIGEEARDGIELSTVGFGMGNYNDLLMEQLADRGDGRYAYVDRLDEAHRLFVEELTGTLQTLGSEARAQVEFNSDLVDRYRLLGYENRDIADERFRDDRVDAGEIGVGHTVTALYEIRLTPEASARLTAGGELATLRLRYRPEGVDRFAEMELRVDGGHRVGGWDQASLGWQLAAVAARFAEVLRGAPWAPAEDLDWLLRQAEEVAERADDERVWELVSMIERARALFRRTPGADWG